MTAATNNHPSLPAAVTAPTTWAFRGLSRLRGRRIFHPYGLGYSGRFEPAGKGALPAGPTQVRLSRAIGLPDAWPDILGLAVRVENAHGSGRHQDLLMVSSGDLPGARHLLLPGARGFFGHRYSSLLTYTAAGTFGLFGARFQRPGAAKVLSLDRLEQEMRDGADLALDFATLAGRWSRLGIVTLDAPLPPEATEALHFNPWNTGGAIQVAAPLMGIRHPAYVGSQQGRGEARS